LQDYILAIVISQKIFYLGKTNECLLVEENVIIYNVKNKIVFVELSCLFLYVILNMNM